MSQGPLTENIAVLTTSSFCVYLDTFLPSPCKRLEAFPSWQGLVFLDSTSKCVLAWVQSALQSFRIRRIMVGLLIRCPSNVVETIDWRLSSRESFKSDQLRLIRIGESRRSWRERNDPENRASSLARLSLRLSQQREFMRHLFSGFSG